MSAILSCPSADTQDSTQVIRYVYVGGRLVLTVGLAPIAPARSAWFPAEGILLLDESAVTR